MGMPPMPPYQGYGFPVGKFTYSQVENIRSITYTALLQPEKCNRRSRIAHKPSDQMCVQISLMLRFAEKYFKTSPNGKNLI